MKNQLKSGQRGVSLLGFIFVGGLLAVTGIVLAQVLPTWLEFQAVNKAVNKAREGNSPAEVRSIFDKASQVDDIKTISGRDLEVAKVGDGYVVSFAYEREIHLVGPAWLTLKYAGRSK